MARPKVREDNADTCRAYRSRKREQREQDSVDAESWRVLCELLSFERDVSAEEIVRAIVSFRIKRSLDQKNVEPRAPTSVDRRFRSSTR